MSSTGDARPRLDRRALLAVGAGLLGAGALAAGGRVVTGHEHGAAGDVRADGKALRL